MSAKTARQSSSRDKTSMTITEFYSDSPEGRSRRSSIAEEEGGESRRETARELALIKVPTGQSVVENSPRAANATETSFEQQASEKQVKSVVKQKSLSIDLFPETTMTMSSSRLQFNSQRLSLASMRRSNSTALVTAPHESTFHTPTCSPCVAAPPKVHVQTLALPVSHSSLYFAFPAFSRQSRFTGKNRSGMNQLTYRERSFANVQLTPTPEHSASSRTTIFDGRKLPTHGARVPTSRSSSLRAGYSSRRLLSILLQQQMELQEREEQRLFARKRSNVEMSLLGRPVGSPRTHEKLSP